MVKPPAGAPGFAEQHMVARAVVLAHRDLAAGVWSEEYENWTPLAQNIYEVIRLQITERSAAAHALPHNPQP